ncbi:hypothetical protein M5D96_005018 [Drosophila gunungcola]|uniref:Uncharacterized protein n=1 Tax=Drosophila gunungcola TaxID=103775 RepID=A0A9Q0BTU1_9MUSC|nr:hypothetical protein M5D96_005018 [Drosophila gunungcola]
MKHPQDLSVTDGQQLMKVNKVEKMEQELQEPVSAKSLLMMSDDDANRAAFEMDWIGMEWNEAKCTMSGQLGLVWSSVSSQKFRRIKYGWPADCDCACDGVE